MSRLKLAGVVSIFALTVGGSAQAQRFKYQKINPKIKLNPGRLQVVLPKGAKLFRRAGDFNLTSDIAVNPKSKNTTVYLTWDVRRVKNAGGVYWQVSPSPFPAFQNGKNLKIKWASTTGMSDRTYGSFKVNFGRLKYYPTGGKPFFVRAVPVKSTKQLVAVGQPSNIIRVYYGNAPKQPPFKFHERFDVSKFKQRLEQSLKGKVTGYQVSISKPGVKTTHLAGGWARRFQDKNYRRMSTNDRFNVASVSKTASAVLTLQLLDNKRLTINSPIAPWLPRSWRRGPNVATITFKQLMTHRSGLRNSDANAVSYQDLKKMIAKGIKMSDKNQQKYQNQNFALLRVIVPIMAGYNPPKFGISMQDRVIDVRTSALFLALMNARVFKPLGIQNVKAKPTGSAPALCYSVPNVHAKGQHWGDYTNRSGGAGLHLSAAELNKFLNGLASGKLLSARMRKTMFDNQLGLFRRNVKGGQSWDHGGYFWAPTRVNGKKIELNSLIVELPTGLRVAIIVNSPAPNPLYQMVIDAHNASWGI